MGNHAGARGRNDRAGDGAMSFVEVDSCVGNHAVVAGAGLGTGNCVEVREEAEHQVGDHRMSAETGLGARATAPTGPSPYRFERG